MESFRLKPTIRAAVITTPALDTPGMIASVCISPIKNIVVKETFSISFLSFYFYLQNKVAEQII